MIKPYNLVNEISVKIFADLKLKEGFTEFLRILNAAEDNAVSKAEAGRY
ncbi:MAG TPA: hypothetical protein VK106_01065 [Balneolaceae bacterium]|nr:hypothetical protein [Balneolaceae bacterium]